MYCGRNIQNVNGSQSVDNVSGSIKLFEKSILLVWLYRKPRAVLETLPIRGIDR